MDLQTETLVRKRFYVGAIQVTEENMVEVGLWVGGVVCETHPRQGEEAKCYIRMPVPRNHNSRARAYAGDWIISTGNSFQSYTEENLWKFYERPGTPEVDRNEKRIVNSDPEMPPLTGILPGTLFFNEKERGELWIVQATPNRVAKRFFGDATYNPETDSLETPEPSLSIPAKVVAQKINQVFQEAARQADWERHVLALMARGPGVFESYSLTYLLDGARIGNTLPEGHDCFEKSCTVETTPDPLAYGKDYIKIYHHHLARIAEDLKDPNAPAKGLHVVGDGPMHSESECGRIGC